MTYDTLLILALLLLATLPWVLLRGNPDPDALNFEPLGLAYQGMLLALVTGYFVVGWCRKGHTLGMRSWRLRLVSLDGGAVHWRQALLRWCAAWVAWLPAAVGIFWQYRDADGLTWHDRWSGTRVVIERKRVRGG